MNIHDKINIKSMISEFSKYGEKDFHTRVQKLRIGQTGEFESSFRMLGSYNGNGLVIDIFYRYYGDFIHLGVGKGVGLEDTGIQRMVGGGRKKKPWKKGIGHTRHRLAELYQAQLGDAMEMQVKDSMDKNVRLNF